jgi:hypothetical protein
MPTVARRGCVCPIAAVRRRRARWLLRHVWSRPPRCAGDARNSSRAAMWSPTTMATARPGKASTSACVGRVTGVGSVGAGICFARAALLRFGRTRLLWWALRHGSWSSRPASMAGCSSSAIWSWHCLLQVRLRRPDVLPPRCSVGNNMCVPRCRLADMPGGRCITRSSLVGWVDGMDSDTADMG